LNAKVLNLIVEELIEDVQEVVIRAIKLADIHTLVIRVVNNQVQGMITRVQVVRHIWVVEVKESNMETTSLQIGGMGFKVKIVNQMSALNVVSLVTLQENVLRVGVMEIEGVDNIEFLEEAKIKIVEVGGRREDQ
jgi:hypothetical protein